MSRTLKEYMADIKSWFDPFLTRELSRTQITERLKESMIYSLTAGGKRFRPMLLFATLESLGKKKETGLYPAIALEMIHTYSLIHDDLPAMDNDELRRGFATNHVRFGEATAILAGDGLLTFAFQIIASDPELSDAEKSRMTWLLARAAGPEGMVGGQEDDLEAEDHVLSIDELMSVHRRKTGRLIRFPVEAAAVISGVSPDQSHALIGYADHLGIAFQIGDDLLDITGNEKMLGKKVGGDLAKHKNTYVSLLSLDGARKQLSTHIEKAKGYLNEAGMADGRLKEIAEYLLHRTS
ncbi:polyprenyl synthetase family protein [Sporolactobacillus sp. THM19-2]|uniref:polyprenyl synthetase family protein n=1 Tax=Sporolactobacillus sp. THM19-2 TaxID=2511171 RepID=UPI001021E080|nr:farnesyl diphosphate synthase [Sporolactobacillus sp. THM19-2]RYL87852.1 polyprenyl synthetase family protein [Sporolactobacillus sp. THM19-2]